MIDNKFDFTNYLWSVEVSLVTMPPKRTIESFYETAADEVQMLSAPLLSFISFR